jgi:hypothetical protein
VQAEITDLLRASLQDGLPTIAGNGWRFDD